MYGFIMYNKYVFYIAYIYIYLLLLLCYVMCFYSYGHHLLFLKSTSPIRSLHVFATTVASNSAKSSQLAVCKSAKNGVNFSPNHNYLKAGLETLETLSIANFR